MEPKHLRSPIRSFHSQEYRHLVGALANARRDAGLSLEELAGRLGCSQSYISRYESAGRRLDVIEFLTIVAAIGVDYRIILDDLKDGGR